jgi:anti-sigma factor RsiW
MTSKFEDFEHEKLVSDTTEEPKLSTDCFELLSAYIDGEASSSQRKQVQIWLDRDPKIKQIYQQLLALQGQMQHSMAPESEKSVAEITTRVFQSIDSSRRQRQLTWAATALAASFIAALAGIVSGTTPFRMKLATTNHPPEVNSSTVMLAVALDRPAINIPKAINSYNFEPKPIKN